MRRFFGLVLFATLAIPPPAPAGSIRYDFRDAHWPHWGLARMDVDDAALARGYFARADVLDFGFQPFFAADLVACAAAIGPDGVPTGEGSLGAARVVDGTTYRLYVAFGPDSFDPDLGGFYQLSGGGTPGIYGYGYWTATIDATPSAASVPEPSGLSLAIVALILGAIGVYLWTTQYDEGGGES